MSKRALTVGFLTVGLSAGVVAAAIGPAAAQGDQVGGSGSYFFLSGAGSTGGAAQKVMNFGNPGDETYFGDWDGSGQDSPMVRRGNTFFVSDDNGQLQSVFSYGDAGDKVLVGDWDGDGKDSIAIQRGNEFFVKNDNTKTGVADATFYYGDPGDTVLVGDWNGDKKDTLAVQRGNHFFVKNDTTTGKADFDFYFGNPGDKVLVGDWADPANGVSGNGADQLAVQRGNHFFLSDDLGADGSGGSKTLRDFYYGDNGDQVFTAKLSSPVLDANGKQVINTKHNVTYTSDVQATYKGGELLWSYSKTAVTDPVTGKQKTVNAGDAQVFLTGDVQYYRGGEPVLDADGTQSTYGTNQSVQIHDPADIYIAQDGSVLRDKTDGHLMTWADVDADNTDFPDVDLNAPSNYVNVLGTDKVVRRAGEVMTTRTEGELEFYVNPSDTSKTFGPEAGSKVVTQQSGDYLLDSSGNLRIDATTNLPMTYTGAPVYATDLAKAGAPVVARPGQPRYGYTYTKGSTPAWSRTLINDLSAQGNLYLAPSLNAPLASTLGKTGPAYYKGGEQLTYNGVDVTDTATTTTVAAEVVPHYLGGEAVIAHRAGEVVLNADGTPKTVGDDQPEFITGDGLGVRRNFN